MTTVYDKYSLIPFSGQGNTTPTGEFNFVIDPEAAAIVLDEFPKCCPVRIVPLEVTHSNCIEWGWICDTWLKQDTPKSAFNRSMVEKFFKKVKQSMPEGYPAWDVLAVGAALQPNFICESFKTYMTVELQGSRTRGQGVIDKKKVCDNLVEIVTKVDQELLRQMLFKSVL